MAAGQRDRGPTPRPRSARRTAGPTELAARYRAGTLPPALQAGLTEFLAAYGHRGGRRDRPRACRAGPRTRRHILGVLANYLRLDDPAAGAGRPVPPRRRARPRRMVDALAAPSRAGAAGPRARCVRFALAAGPAAGRPARAAQVLHGPGAGARRARQLVGGRARRWPQRAGWSAPTTSSSWTWPRPARRSPAPTCARWSRAPRGSATTRSCAGARVPRVLLSDGTEPEAAAPAPGRRPDGRCCGAPRLGGHRHRRGPGGPRPARGSARARARSWWRRRPTRAGRRCSSPPAAW